MRPRSRYDLHSRKPLHAAQRKQVARSPCCAAGTPVVCWLSVPFHDGVFGPSTNQVPVYAPTVALISGVFKTKFVPQVPVLSPHLCCHLMYLLTTACMQFWHNKGKNPLGPPSHVLVRELALDAVTLELVALPMHHVSPLEVSMACGAARLAAQRRPQLTGCWSCRLCGPLSGWG